MPELIAPFIPWNSQPLEAWSQKHARGQFVDLGGRRTHYIEKGEGEPVILLHGFFFDSYLWAANIDALAQHFKVYALDLWGWGFSTREPLDHGYALYTEQLLRFMDSLGIRRASLVGQSMGAGTAIRFSVEHRERVNKLLLVDAAGLPNPLPFLAKVSNLRGVGEFLMGMKNDSFRKTGLREAFIHDKRLITDEFYENATLGHKVAGSTEVYMGIMRKEFFGTLSNEIDRLGAMDVPTLLVWGREDKAISLSRGEELHRRLKGSRLEVLDNAAHVPNYERAQEFNQLAVDFLRE